MGVILGLAVALGVLVWLIFRDSAEEEQHLTAEQLSRYEAGTFYRTIVTSTVQGEIEDEDWGVATKVTLVHEGEVDVVREVRAVAEDFTKLEMGLEILAARDLEVRLDLNDVKFELPPAVGILVKAGRKFLFRTPVERVGDLAVERVEEWLRSEENRAKVLSRVEAAVEAVTGKGIGDHLLSAEMRPLEDYEGLKADYSYEAGKGLTEFTSYGALGKEQEERMRNFSVFSEAYLMPDVNDDGPRQWEVDVRTIAHLLVPSGKLNVSGTLTLERGETEAGVTRLRIVKGKVVFTGGSDTREVLGTWAARGDLFYDQRTHHVAKGLLDGAVSLERRSTDHVLFQEKFRAEPTYRVVIMGTVSPKAEDARKPIENVLIK